MTEIKSKTARDPSQSIVEWYKNQVIFITGGTGFIGKALIFKLLQIGAPKIYLLIRTKKGVDPEDRLDELAKHRIYDPIREKDPGFRSKLIAVSGNVTLFNLGLSDQERQILQDEVTTVFHVAASIRFDDDLKTATMYNLRSTLDAVELAKGMRYLKAFHYVSTAYSNSDHMEDHEHGIEERLYKLKVDYKKLISFVTTSSNELINALELKIIGASMNTYVFTKHLAEWVVHDAANSIPAVISRPEIVLPSYREPYKGWLDNISSPVAILGGSGKGILRAYPGVEKAPKAYVPVDSVVNSILISTWQKGAGKTNETLPIYQTAYYPIDAAVFKDLSMNSLIWAQPPYKGIWRPKFYTFWDRRIFLLMHVVLHLIPGLIVDSILWAKGNQPRLIRMYRKLYLALMALYPVLNISDRFVTDNYKMLENATPDDEKDIFPLDLPNNHKMFLEYMIEGAKGLRHLLNEPPSTEEDFQHLKRLCVIDTAFLTACGLLFLWMFPWSWLQNISQYIINSLVDVIREN